MDDRQRLEAIISVVCKYLPPDGIHVNVAMSEIISILVDPLPPQPAQEPVAWLTNDERKALERFTETCDDGEGYDVPKQMMQRLAQIGVVHHTSGGVYSTTEFGRWVIDAAPPQRERVVFPTMLRKMWSGGEVQAWLDENVNKEQNNG